MIPPVFACEVVYLNLFIYLYTYIHIYVHIRGRQYISIYYTILYYTIHTRMYIYIYICAIEMDAMPTPGFPLFEGAAFGSSLLSLRRTEGALLRVP